MNIYGQVIILLPILAFKRSVFIKTKFETEKKETVFGVEKYLTQFLGRTILITIRYM